ncbi:MAG: nickel-responsive transcriptional regulator NikR [Planctomycetota bacterium]|jgi:CopG family nickel-responsive transcriptional regulator
MSQTERVGVSLDKKLLSMFDELISRQGYSNRSEAIRDLIRTSLSEERLAKPSTQAVAGVFLVYDHHSTQLSGKLVELQHSHLLQVIASTHVHLDHHNCRKVREIEKVADNMACLRGVKLSKVNVMTTGKHLP